MPTRRRPFAPSVAALAAALVATATLVGGCTDDASISRAGDPHSFLKCESVSTDQVTVGPPVVEIRNGVMSISGSVRRKPGVTALLDGRVDLDLIGPDGLKLDKSLHAPLVPNDIPMGDNGSSRYAPTPFGFVPPANSTVRARYVTRMEGIKESIDDGILDYNGNNGHTGNDVPRSQENGSTPANATGGATP